MIKKELKYTKKGLKPKTKATFSSQGANSSQEANPKEKEEISSLEEEEVVVGASSQKRENSNIKRKNTLLNDLRNLIKTAHTDKEKDIKKLEEEPLDQYGVLVFKDLNWKEPPKEKVFNNYSERSKKYRRRIYSFLSAINTNEFKTFSEIVKLSSQKTNLLNTLYIFGSFFDDTIVSLYSKKDTLDKLNISDLEKLKNSFEELLSTKTIIEKMFKHLLLDYQNDTNHIKTNLTKPESHVNTLFNQIIEIKEKAQKLKNIISSIYSSI
ncbi:virulence associated lipoprotein [Borreliella americana]|uniref:virulence associated lipoprotein n=1 Tax=Borreliella americana TaxID=478807 RepID=UPI0030810C4C